MIILIDNYDSFTWNLYHFLGDLGQDVKVIRNDKADINELIDQDPKGFVISPGPCLLYTSPSPRDRQKSRMPSSA